MTQTAPETEALIAEIVLRRQGIEPTAWIGRYPDDEPFITYRCEVADAWTGAPLEAVYNANALQALSAERDELNITVQRLLAAGRDDVALMQETAVTLAAATSRANAAEAQVTTLTEAAEREREECAKMAEDIGRHNTENDGWDSGYRACADEIASAIRTRTHTERKGP